MIRPAFEIGARWAYREKPHTEGWPVLQIEILQFGPPRSQKLRVRFIDGEYPGIDMWVPQVRLRVPWVQAEAWLDDERRFSAVWQASRDAYDSLEFQAAQLILFEYPRPDGILPGFGPHEGAIVQIADLSTVAADLGMDADELLREPLAYVDREGTYVGPWPVTYRLARRVAEVYSDRVVEAVSKEERKLQDGATHGRTIDPVLKSSAPYYVPAACWAKELRERQPLLDLVREWCGRASVERFNEVEALRAEVIRLRHLVQDAADKLEQAGQSRPARQLLNKLGG